MGRDVTRAPAMERVGKGVGRSFQIPQPFEGMTVCENLAFAASFGRGQLEAAGVENCARILQDWEFFHHANTPAGAQSLLDRKRLELARALATGPELLLLLDEIAGGPTEGQFKALVATFKGMHAKVVTIIWIEHVLHALTALVEQLLVLDFRRVIGLGEPGQISDRLSCVRQGRLTLQQAKTAPPSTPPISKPPQELARHHRAGRAAGRPPASLQRRHPPHPRRGAGGRFVEPGHGHRRLDAASDLRDPRPEPDLLHHSPLPRLPRHQRRPRTASLMGLDPNGVFPMSTGFALVVGTAPAGSTAAALLARHGVEVLGRMQTSGTSPDRKARHLRASPCEMNDLPQTFMEPILFKTPCSRGAQSRMSTEYVSQVQDDGGVTITCRDRLSGKDLAIRSKDLVGADGGNSLRAEHLGLSFEGKMGVGEPINILFRADLSRHVAHRPSVHYWVMQPGADVGGIGVDLVRVVRRGIEWLIRPGLRHQPARTHRRCRPGNPDRAATGRCAGSEIELIRANTWTVNNCLATHMQKGRAFIVGDAAHRHPLSKGLGSNTSIHDAFNLARKPAGVIKGQAMPKLLGSYSAERTPIAQKIVTRANQSIAEFSPIFQTLGMDGGGDDEKIHRNMAARCDATPAAKAPRAALRKAIAVKTYEFDCHGIKPRTRIWSCTTSPPPTPARACRMPGSTTALPPHRRPRRSLHPLGRGLRRERKPDGQGPAGRCRSPIRVGRPLPGSRL